MDILNTIWILILILFGIIILFTLFKACWDWLLDNEEIFTCLILIMMIAAGVVIGMLIFRSCF